MHPSQHLQPIIHCSVVIRPPPPADGSSDGVIIRSSSDTKEPGNGPVRGGKYQQLFQKLVLQLQQRQLFLWNRVRGKGVGSLFNTGSRKLNWRRSWRPLLAGLVVLLVWVALASRGVRTRAPPPVELPFSRFMELVQQHPGSIENLQIDINRYNFLHEGRRTFSRTVKAAPQTLQWLHDAGMTFGAAPTGRSSLVRLLLNLLPFFWLYGIFSYGNRMVGAGGGNMPGKESKGQMTTGDVTFDQVAGIDQAKAEVQEMVEMLKDPARYAQAGARLVSGVLLIGPPGTGKTLLARAMAAEAGVPFFYCSGSEFVELFVGRGPARVRALFDKAAKQRPCVIFFDELDAVGRKRGMGLGLQQNDEAERTLNQMLACMDGLDTNNNGVIVMGATNRYEIIDEALTRPGRFDRIVQVSLPDQQGRLDILKVHARKINLANSDANLEKVAEATPGCSGAELASIMNEAAIRAVRANKLVVEEPELLGAVQNFFSSRGKGTEQFLKRLFQ